MAKQSRPKTNITMPEESFWKRLGSRLSEGLDAAPVVIGRVVNGVLKFFLRGSAIERTIRELLPIVDEINRLEATTVRMSDEELRSKTDEFRQRVQAGETLDDVLPEAFAVAREAADRRNGMCNVLKPEHGFDPAAFEREESRQLFLDASKRLEAGEKIWDLMFPASFYAEVRALYPDYRPPFRMRPFDVQLIGGIVLHQGKIAEMVTGEGKTLVATLPAYLNTLGGGHVHIVTVNDYLARVGRDWNEPMFRALGVTVGAIQSDMDPSQRHPEYAADITYGTNNEFGFDYLRDNMKDNLEDQAQGPLQYAIIDEVDSILIDEARTPLIISGPAEESSERYYIANRMVKTLSGVNAQRLPRDELQREKTLQNFDYTFNLKDHSVSLTERGITAAQRFLGVDNIYHGRNMDWPPFIEAALKAKELYKLDVDYVIRDGEVVIVDEFTGRLMPGRRWSDGLHQAVEAKEAPRGARIKEENQTLATITFQNFFRLYDKISGMTGTALTEAGEFQKIYKLDVVPIPTNRPLRRTEYHDLIYGTAKEKWTAIVDEIVSVHQTGRPILVGTISIEASEKLSRLLERRGIEHEVLNAKHHEREALIVKDAGQFGAVTVATNMAGRGTDIMLGRCTWQQVLAHLKESGLTPRDISPNVGREEAQSQLERYWYEYWDLGKDNGSPSDEEVLRRLEAHWRDRGMHPIVLGENVAELGGLHIVATERHEARRIDNQLRGRAGRQGDPGSSRFFVSLEDDLMKIFMAQWVRNFMVRAGLSEGQPIESGMVSRAIERAQRKVEEQNFEVRKNLLEYDEVMDEQRKLIYDQRQEVLEGGERLEPVEIIQRGVDRYIQREAADLPARVFDLLRQTAAAAGVDVSRDEWEGADRDGLETILRKKAEQAFRVGVGREAVDAWVGQLLADGRADGGEYPEHWQLGRLARWAQNLGLDVSEAQLSDIVRERLADVVADAAKARRRGDVDDLLRDWFVVGYEQDLALLSRSGRWELDTFRHWLSTVGVSIEIVEWTPARTTCEALTPLWLEAARKAFAGRSPADVAGELARAAAALYLGSSALRHRPDARRIAYWAERRLAVEVTPYALLDAYDSVVAPALVRAVADPVEKRLASLSTSAAADAWATATAAWHLDAHLRFQAHHVVGLATYLSARLRVGLNSLELARHPVDAIPGYVLEQLETHGSTQVDGESFEGLEDIAFNMVDGALARLVENSLADRIGSTPTERSFAPLATWANELSLSLAEEQWRAFDLHELRLHFLREAADAYPAETSGELVEDFIPRFARSPVQRFLNSDGFREQPSYASLAGWAVERYGYLPRDSQVEAQVKRFAEDSLKETCARLVEAKLEDFGQERIEIDNAVEDLVPPTLDALRSLSEGDEVDLGGLAAFARKVFDVSIPVHRLEEEAQGDEREAVRVLTNQAKGRYARRGLDGLVGDAVAGIFELCMPSEQFPTEWRCEVMHDWLRATGLSAVLSAEDLREDTLGAIRSYFERAALDALRERPAEQTRDVLVTAALQVFLESSLAEEGNDFMGLANALHGKFGLDVDPLELSKLDAGELEERLRGQVLAAYEARKRQLGAGPMLWTIRQILLQTIDLKWKDHLYNMDHLRGVIGFRGYGQKDPKVEYKREGYEMFDTMTRSIEDSVTDYLLKVEFSFGERDVPSVWHADSYIHEAAQVYQQQQEAAAAPQGGEAVGHKPIMSGKEPGRNDPCPCGKTRADGKPVKYKNCCGRRRTA